MTGPDSKKGIFILSRAKPFTPARARKLAELLLRCCAAGGLAGLLFFQIFPGQPQILFRRGVSRVRLKLVRCVRLALPLAQCRTILSAPARWLDLCQRSSSLAHLLALHWLLSVLARCLFLCHQQLCRQPHPFSAGLLELRRCRCLPSLSVRSARLIRKTSRDWRPAMGCPGRIGRCCCWRMASTAWLNWRASLAVLKKRLYACWPICCGWGLLRCSLDSSLAGMSEVFIYDAIW